MVRDIRTIQRNLDVLARYFNVDKDTRDKPYGYSRRSINKRTVGAREGIILSLVEEQLKQVLPKELMSAVESTFMEAMIRHGVLSGQNITIDALVALIMMQLPMSQEIE